MKEIKPKKFKDSYEFFEWLEKSDYDLEAITIEINGKHHLITMDKFKSLSHEKQQEIIDLVFKNENPLVYPPGCLKLIEPLNDLN